MIENNFDFKLIRITTCLYSEIVYLDETINFYRKQGFDLQYFYLFYLEKELKNESIFEKIRKKYKDQKDVIIIHLLHSPRISLIHFYKNYYNKYKNDWITNCDLDEFFYSPLENKKVKDIIKMYEEKNLNAIYVNWRIFGNDYLNDNPDYKVLNIYKKCSDKFYKKNKLGRSFFKLKYINFENLKRILRYGHTFPLNKECKYYNTNMEEILHITENMNKCNRIGIENKPENKPLLICNHYQYKSFHECKMKNINNQVKKKLGLSKRYEEDTIYKLQKYLNVFDNVEILKKI